MGKAEWLPLALHRLARLAQDCSWRLGWSEKARVLAFLTDSKWEALTSDSLKTNVIVLFEDDSVLQNIFLYSFIVQRLTTEWLEATDAVPQATDVCVVCVPFFLPLTVVTELMENLLLSSCIWTPFQIIYLGGISFVVGDMKFKNKCVLIASK